MVPQKDPLGILGEQPKKQADPLGILKKKEVSGVELETGGEAGTSEAPLGLRPAKIQPTIFKEPSVGEDTMLARKLAKEQRAAVATTGVKLPAAPRIIAEEKAAERALAPKLEPKIAKDEQGWLANTVSALDKGFYKNLIGNPIKGLGTVIQYGTEAMTGGRVKEGPVSDALMRFGNWFNNAIDEVTPQDPEFKNSLSDQFAQAFGQVGSIVLTGGLGAGGRGAGIATQAVPSAGRLAPAVAAGKELVSEITSPAAISAGLTMGQAEFDRAKQAGATDDQAFEAFYKNAAVGSILEKVPVMQFFKRFNNATAGGVANYIKTKGVAGITGGLEEATTEVLQQVYANKTAKDIYNTNQDIFEGLTESGGIGFGVGFLLNAMGANAKILRKQGKETEAQLVDAQIKEFESRAEKGSEAPPAPPAPVSQVPVTPEKAPIETIEVEEVARQMQPITDKMAQIEREFENLGYKIDTDYDNEIIISDIEGNEIGEIPETLVPLAAEYETATRKLGEFDDRARERALSKSREVVDVEAVEVKPQISKEDASLLELSLFPKYRVEYFDPTKGEMTHSFFDTKEEGDRFMSSLTDQQKSKGVQAYFQKTTEPSLKVGEVALEAKPELPAAPIEELEKEYRGKSVEELVSLKKELYPAPDIETPMTPEEKLLDRVIADKFSDINKDIVEKRKTAEESPRFTSYEDAQKWIENKSKEYKSRNEFLASKEYKDALPDINALYKVEKADYVDKAKGAMEESGVKIGDRVIYDYITPFGAETYSGQIVERDGVPFVKFDEGQATMSGKKSVRWHKGFVKEEATQAPAAPAEEELPFGEGREIKTRKKRQITNKKRRALNIEIVDNPRGEVLQYFIGDGKVSEKSLANFFESEKQGYRWEKSKEEEKKLRKSLTSKNPKAPSIEELAEKIAGVDRFDRVQDFRNAIEEVLLNHNRAETMADELVRDYDLEFAEMEKAAELEEISKEIEEEAQAFVSQIPPAQQEEILKVLNRFRYNDGFINWRQIGEEIKDGFEPVILELSEPSQKIINDAIKQFEETGRVGRISPEALPAKAGDAARSLAERIRAGKITRKGLQVSTGLDAIWDAALEVVATSLEAGASIADAIQDGIRYIRSTDFYKSATNKKQIEENFANQLNEEYAIQEQAAGEIPVQPEAGTREKVEAGVPPTRPKKAPEEGEAEGRKEERRFSKTLINSPELLKAVKKGVGATLEYTRQANAMSVAQAQEILDVLGEDKAYDAMRSPETSGAVRVVLGQVLIKRYNKLAKEATTKEDRNLYLGTTIDIAEYVTVSLATEAGQTIQAFSLWDKLTPEAQLLAATRQVKKSARANVDKVRGDIDNIREKFNKANEETIKEILKSEEVDRSIKRDTQEGVKKAKDRAAKARQKRADIIKKYKGKGGITLTTGGLTKEGIEFVGEVALTYIEEGLAEVQVIAEKIFADIKSISGSSPNDKVKQEVFEIAENELSKSDLKIVKSVKDQKLKINEIAIKHFTEVEKIKENLAQKFVDEADMEEANAEALAKRFEDAFDRVVSRKKAEILAKNKKRFDRIQKAINEQAEEKAEKKTLQDEIIKYSNLGAFKADDMLDYLAKKFNLGQLTAEQAAKIEELAEKIQTSPEGTPKREATEDLLSYQANLNKGNWGEVAQGIWYANILSGYRTHEKNIVSTFFNSLADLGTEVIADPKGAPYLIAGYMQGVGKKGLLEAMRTLKTGRSPIHVRAVEIPDILERKKFIGGGYNPANWFKYVGRAMKAEDILSFQGLKEARAWQLARKEAEKYGFNTWTRSGWQKVNELLLNTTERFEIAKDQAIEEGLVENSPDFKRRIYELMENSRPEAMTEDAYNFAAHGTYNYKSDGTLGAFTNAISNALDVKIGGVQPGRFVVPFTRIITNVVNNALDYSPVGVIRAAKGARGFRSFDEFSLTKGAYKPLTPEQRRIVAVKAAVGISFAAIIQYMVSAGLIDMSGEGPEDEKKKAQLREQGWQPYSLKIGDTWYSYFYTPLVLTLGWMGNLNDAAKYGKEDEETLLRRASIASLKFGGMIADMTWINSAATFLGALNEPKINEQQRRVENALSGMARGFVPFAQNITQLTQAYNSTFRVPAKQVNNSWEAFYQDIPIARNSLNNKINALGEPVIKDVDIMWSKEKGEPIWSYLTNKKGWVAPLNKKTVLVFDQKLKQDRPLTDNEFYELSKLRGGIIKKNIQELMENGYVVKRKGRNVNVAAEDLTSSELNDILSKRIEPFATRESKKKLFGDYRKQKEEEGSSLGPLKKQKWSLVD